MPSEPAAARGDDAATAALRLLQGPGMLGELRDVEDVGRIVSMLLDLTGRLPSVFTFLAGRVSHEAAAGRVSVSSGPNAGDPEAGAAEAAELLRQVGELSLRLHTAARWAHMSLTELAVPRHGVLPGLGRWFAGRAPR